MTKSYSKTELNTVQIRRRNQNKGMGLTEWSRSNLFGGETPRHFIYA